MSILKRVGIITFAALVMFAVTSCDDGGGGGGEAKIPQELRGQTWEDYSGNSLQFGSDKIVLNGTEYTVIDVVDEEGGVKRIVFSGSGNYIRVKGGNIIEVHIGTTQSQGDRWEKKTTGDFIYTGTTTITITGYKGGYFVDITIPVEIDGKPVTAIDNWAFHNKGLTGVIIPDNVTYIGESAFFKNLLTSVTIPASVTTIGEWAFGSNPELLAINVDVNNPNYNSIDGVLYNKSNSILLQWPTKKTPVSIPNNVTTIVAGAFSGNQLTSVIIPDNVTTIGAGAFSDNQLTSVIIPDNVTTIGASAFSGNQLTSITIPDSVTEIRDYTFFDNQLESVTISNSVTHIGSGAFLFNNKLTSITIGANVTFGTETTAFDANFVIYYKETYNKQAGTYTRPNTNSNVWTKVN